MAVVGTAQSDSASESVYGDETLDLDMKNELTQLIDMGFDREKAVEALAELGDLGQALERLTEAPLEPAPGGDLLQPLLAMGFAEAAARRVAKRASDVEEALELLGEAEADEPAPVPRARSRSRSPRVPVVAPGRKKKELETYAEKVKSAVVDALGGPEGKRKAQVVGSIRRGRVAMWKNQWQKDGSEDHLESISPGYSKLKGYQRVGVRWLLALAKLGHGGILADEMGLGKTAQALVFLDLLLKTEKKASRVVLAVVPVAVLSSWERECATWCPHFRVFRYHAGSMKDRYAAGQGFLAQPLDRPTLVLTTGSMLGNKEDRSTFFRHLNFEYVICDEAHHMRNAATNSFRHVDRLPVKRRLLLTGTPVHNSLQELGNLLKLLLVLSQPSRPFMVRLAKDLEGVIERQSLQTLQVRAAPFMMRRLKKDVMGDLPEKTCKAQRCVLTVEQRKLYDSELERAKSGSKKLRKAQARKFLQNLLHRLRRLCNHPLLTQARFAATDYELLYEALRLARPDFAAASAERCMEVLRKMDDYEVLSQVKAYNLQGKLAELGLEPSKCRISRDELMNSAKLQELMKILESQREAKQKTLVFSQFTMYLDIIEAALKVHQMEYARLDGACALESRQQSIDLFQKEGSGVDVFLLSMKAGGIGLNLTAANRVVLMDLSWNPQDNRQAEDRAHRLGQVQPVTVTYLTTADTIEEKVVSCNVAKMELDYKFGGQKTAFDTAFDASSDEEAPKQDQEADACLELGEKLGIL